MAYRSKSTAKTAAKKLEKQLGGKWHIDLRIEYVGRFARRRMWYVKMYRGSLMVIQYNTRTFWVGDTELEVNASGTTLIKALRELTAKFSASTDKIQNLLSRVEKYTNE